MAKKTIRLSSEIARKDDGYISGGLQSLLKTVSKKEREENLVRINFEVSAVLRNEFKSKTAKEGKKVKDVLVCFMKEYVEKNMKEKS